jgi:hypothetical protein
MLDDKFMQNKPQSAFPQMQAPNPPMQEPQFSGFNPMSGSSLLDNLPEDAMPFSNPNQGAISPVTIVRMILIDTGTYNDQFRRSYNTDMTRSSIDTIVERMQGQPHFTAAALGGVAGSFLQPSPTWESKVGFGEDWDRPRCRFVMEVEYTFNGGTRVREFVTGGTSHVGVVQSMGTANRHGALDPEMKFKINNIVRVRESMIRTPVGNQINRVVNDASHLISNNNWNGVFNTTQHETRLRPADTFAIMSRSHLDLGGEVFDTRSSSQRTPVKSDRMNGNPAAYLTKMLTGYRDAVANNQREDMMASELLGKARAMVEEQSVNRDKFLTALRAVQQGAMVSDTFTWRDLVNLQPTVEHVTEVRLLAPAARMNAHRTGQTKTLGGSDNVDVAQAIISQSVPAIMLNYGITVLSFHATNKVPGSRHVVAISNMQSLANDDLSRYAETIKNELINFVLNDISYNGDMAYEMHVNMDVLGQTTISISLDNDYGEYAIPSFLDSLMAPVVTSDSTRSATIANDFEVLMTTVVGDYSGAVGNKGHHFETPQQSLMDTSGMNRPVEPFRM